MLDAEMTVCNQLQMLRHSGTQHSVKFTKYDQSSQCTCISDSSVSYASAVVTTA